MGSKHQTIIREKLVRFPAEVFEELSRAANAANKSVNAIVVESVQRTLRDREYQALYEGFTVLGGQRDEADVEFAVESQREILSE